MAFKSKAKDKTGETGGRAAARPVRAVETETVADEQTDTDVGEDVRGDDGGEEAETGKKGKEEKFEYEVMEAGAIIHDIHYPNKDAKKGEEMIAKLTHREAQQHQMQGVPLRRRKEE